MYYNFYYKHILINYFNNFNSNLINYISGIYNENEFKVFRLQFGIYRQRYSYMNRLSILGGRLNSSQLLLISYVSFKYDKMYFHLTTRTNIQFNWIKIIYIFYIFEKFTFLFINPIQSSGNCVRNITSSSSNINKLSPDPWSEIIRQWFNLNFEFLFLPRKFKISILTLKKDDIIFKAHDLGLYIKKNNFNNIICKLLIGGGLGRTPCMGFYFKDDFHWKNILLYIEKIIRIYNIYGFRNNIYKSRLKILIKSLDNSNFLNFFYKEFNYSFKKINIIGEKEINSFYNYLNFYNFNLFNLKKKILFNFFFLNWIKHNYLNNLLYLPLKNKNKSPGDLFFLQSKIIYFFLEKNYYFKIYNRQNIIFENFKKNIYIFYLKLKKYFFNIFNTNLITDNISCPGKDYCSLANARSISISNLIGSIFIDMNTVFKIGNLYINISGCVNSCAHHHIANIGILGVDKNNDEFYQIFLGGNFNNYDSLIFSKSYTSSIIYFKLSLFLTSILKKFLSFNFNKKKFVNIYNRFLF